MNEEKYRRVVVSVSAIPTHLLARVVSERLSEEAEELIHGNETESIEEERIDNSVSESTGKSSSTNGKAEYHVKCSVCQSHTTVPFKPNPNYPVYCRTCYLDKRNGGK